MALQLSDWRTSDDYLVRDIVAELKRVGQAVQHCADPEDAARFRSLGRRAGRELGRKVRTYESDPEAREDRAVVAVVLVIESSPLHEQLVQVRGEKKARAVIDAMVSKLHLSDPPAR